MIKTQTCTLAEMKMKGLKYQITTEVITLVLPQRRKARPLEHYSLSEGMQSINHIFKSHRL